MILSPIGVVGIKLAGYPGVGGFGSIAFGGHGISLACFRYGSHRSKQKRITIDDTHEISSKSKYYDVGINYFIAEWWTDSGPRDRRTILTRKFRAFKTAGSTKHLSLQISQSLLEHEAQK